MNLIMSMLQSYLLNISYSNEQLQRFCALSCILVQKDIPFNIYYDTDFDNLTISPEPTDKDFCIFCAMQAAILIVQNELRVAASQAIKIVDGPSQIDLSSYKDGLASYLKDLRSDYEKAKIEYQFSGKVDYHGYSVSTPFNIENL